MTAESPAISAASGVLAHTPGLVVHGSKPARVLRDEADPVAALSDHLRDFDQACRYPPHQAYIGAMHPRDLPPRPWAGAGAAASRWSAQGEIMPEEEFLGLMAAVDEFDLIGLSTQVAKRALVALEQHPFSQQLDLSRIEKAAADSGRPDDEPGALPLQLGSGELAGVLRGAHEEDESLTASVLLENLANKASGTLAVLHLLNQTKVASDSVDYVISCSEEAVGDRYQRGGGNMAKAIAAAAGLSNAAGADVKNFCAAPIPAIVIAASLVQAGVFGRVIVCGGGSLPKLGMKFEGHLKHDLPVLEDVIGGSAAIIERGDGTSARIRLDAVGRHRVSDGSSNPQVMQALGLDPLERLGLTSTDVDDFATELHNPEITEPQGSGNVPERNYRTLAALAARRGDISRDEIDAFVERRGMPGFSPTQGHLASALCYLPHAVRRLGDGSADRVLMMAKGSLFLGRMTQQSDGMSVLLEAPTASQGASTPDPSR